VTLCGTPDVFGHGYLGCIDDPEFLFAIDWVDVAECERKIQAIVSVIVVGIKDARELECNIPVRAVIRAHEQFPILFYVFGVELADPVIVPTLLPLASHCFGRIYEKIMAL
jgi:hypothetical protein